MDTWLSLSLLLDFNSPLLVLCSMDLWDCCRVFRHLQSLSKTSLLGELKPLSFLKYKLMHSLTMILIKLCGLKTQCYSLHLQKQLNMACKQVFQRPLMLRIRLGDDSGNSFFMTLGVTLLLCDSQTRTHGICFENSYSKTCSFFGVARNALPPYLGE
jgi:hypothetical protein